MEKNVFPIPYTLVVDQKQFNPTFTYRWFQESSPSHVFRARVLDVHEIDYYMIDAVANCMYPLEWPS